MNLFNSDSEEVQVRMKNKWLKANELEQDLEKMYSILKNTSIFWGLCFSPLVQK